MSYSKGTFLGTTLLQQSGSIGGARSVFVKLQGNKNELVFPTFGGQLMNPFNGKAKFYAGDLLEYRTNAKGFAPSIYLLKTYKTVACSGTTLKLERGDYSHIPFVGDYIMVAPAYIGGEGTAVKITAVTATTATVDTATVNVWECTTSANSGAAAGNIIVEAEAFADGTSATKAMLVKKINAVAPCDYECFYDGSEIANPSNQSNDFAGAKFLFTPALGGIMYKHKMSYIPACVEALNECNVDGWFKVDALSRPAYAQAAQEAAAALANKIRYSASTAPTTATVGAVGDIFIVGTGASAAVYVCTAVNVSTTTTYTWTVVANKNAA